MEISAGQEPAFVLFAVTAMSRVIGQWASGKNRTPLFLEKLARRYAFDPPKEHGCDTVNCIKAMHRGQIKVFFALGGNFLSATPDTELTAEALSRCRLTAHVSTKLNRAHLVTGRHALILPCLGRSEIDQRVTGNQFVTVEDSMGIINPSRGRLAAASEHLLSEPAIVARLAEAVLGKRSKLPWIQWGNDYNLIRDEIEQVIPGFEQFNARISRGIFYLPNPPRDERKFSTPTGKAIFTLNPIERLPVEAGEYVLMTIRSHDQFNTTIYGLDDRYRGIYNGRRVIFMNPEDIEEAGLTQGQPVDITSHFEGYERQANRFIVAPYSIPRALRGSLFSRGQRPGPGRKCRREKQHSDLQISDCHNFSLAGRGNLSAAHCDSKPPRFPIQCQGQWQCQAKDCLRVGAN